MEIYIGNLSKKITKEELQLKFEKYGQVLQIKFKMDLFTKEQGIRFYQHAGPG